MSKKRVHELARDLGLDNREVMQALQSAGIVVKTHSSSVSEEEALAVLNKMKDQTPAAALLRRPGMVIVKKRKDADVDTTTEDENNFGEAPEAFVDESSEAQVEVVACEVSFEQPSKSSVAAKPVPEEAKDDSQHDTSPRQVHAGNRQELLADVKEQVVAAPKHSESLTKPAESAKVSSSEQKVSEHKVHRDAKHGAAERQHPSASKPHSPAHDHKATTTVVTTRAKPSTTGATVVRMIDREKLLERVPARRLGGGRGGQDSRGYQSRGPGSGPGAAGGRPSGGPPGRPGAPRPGMNRPGGSGGGGRPGEHSRSAGPPNSGSGPRFGQVTELKVVTDPFGRGREMVAVGREKKRSVAGGPGGGVAGAGNKANPNQPARNKNRVGGKRDIDMRERSLHPARLKRKKSAKSTASKGPTNLPRASKRVIKMKENIVVAELAQKLGVKAVDVIRKLMSLGTMVTQNQTIDFDTAQVIAAEYEYTVDSVAFTEDTHIEEETLDLTRLTPRPPVVTVMGHVDHGKTSLLDAIRKSRVAAGEAGGITQHIGAYTVEVGNKGSVTFLDTPGHAAFTSMRARGAQVTDIVVLVVAADDGVMPQTEEAIRHAQAAKVPLIVAVNKIDKPDAQADRVMQELTKFELLPEAWGGDTLYVNTSATQGIGIEELLETILLQAEVLQLRADHQRPATGVVIEAELDKGRGPVATVLVKQGLLKQGDAVVVGGCYGKIRAMVDYVGKQLKEAGPSHAVEITGLDNVPAAGDALNVVESAEAARAVAMHRLQQKRLVEQGSSGAMSLDDLMKRMETTGALELKIVLKADVQGSVEAVQGALLKLATEEAKVNVIYGGVGGIKESDIMLAAASGGLVLGFGVRPDTKARQIADREGVEIRTYNIIYEAVDEVRRAMEGLLSPLSREKILGRAEVRELFKVSKVGVIGGARVVDGKAIRSAKVRVLRDSVQVYDGKVASLRHFKNDVREVDTGLECGVGVEGYNDIKVGDVIEFYMIEEVARTLSDAPSSNMGSKRPSPSSVDQRMHNM